MNEIKKLWGMKEKMDLQQKIAFLVEQTECSESQADSVLNAKDGNLQAAIVALKNVSKDFTAIKGFFVCGGIDQSGLFFLMIDSQKKYIQQISAMVTNRSDVIQTNLDMPWKAFKKLLVQKKMSGEIVVQGSEDLQNGLKEHLNSADAAKALSATAQKNSSQEIKHILGNAIGRIMGDAHISIKVKIEAVAKSELGSSSKNEPSKAEEPKKAERLPQEGDASEALMDDKTRIKIKFQYILDPINGISISNINPGDRVYVLVDDDNHSNLQLSRILEIEDFDPAKPIMGTVISKFSKAGSRYHLILYSGKGVGEFLGPGELKISSPENKSSLFSKKNIKSFISMAFLISLFILFMIFVFIVLTVIFPSSMPS